MSRALQRTRRRLKTAVYRVGHLAPVSERVEHWLRRRQVQRADELIRGIVAGREPVTPDCLVATVIATYRRPELLVRAVESALAQTITDHHVVVVDDGGGGLPALPASPRVHVVALPANTGNSGLVRNVGIELSRSTYIAFLDDDNTWTPTHLADCLGALEGGAILCYTGVEVVDEQGTVLRYLGRPFSRAALRRGNYVDANAMVFRRTSDARCSVLWRRRASSRSEDWELVYRLSRRGRVDYVPTPSVRYLQNPASYFTTWLP